MESNSKSSTTRPMFPFGKNWTDFSTKALTQDHIDQARADFSALTEGLSFQDQSFLDIGFGQGLVVHLASERGARVTGIDIDSHNLDAFRATHSFFNTVTRPEVFVASILNQEDIAKLQAQGPFDIVHSWGVLHHTGDMYVALEHTLSLVKPGGHLILALYNQHWSSPLWKIVKYGYNVLPNPGKKLLEALFYPILSFALRFLYRTRSKQYPRGMSFYTDLIDWLGGYPYEYASKDRIELLMESRGFLVKHWIAPIVPTGNNQWVFQRTP